MITDFKFIGNTAIYAYREKEKQMLIIAKNALVMNFMYDF